MSSHALFSPSAAHRWIECPGSFAYPGNTSDEESSSTYADDGTASHEWAAKALRHKCSADRFLGETLTINDRVYTMDEERAAFVQVYLDLVERLSLGKVLLIEHRVDLPELGEGQGGTADAVILEPDMVTIIDLKYGMGEKVTASYTDEQTGEAKPNHQLGLYAAGALRDAAMLGFPIVNARLIICQPRIGNISETTFQALTITELMDRAKGAAWAAGHALISTPDEAMKQDLMHPSEKTCRWCRAKAECPKLRSWVVETTRADFDEVAIPTAPPQPGVDEKALSVAARAVPLIRMWCSAVDTAVIEAVTDGKAIIGTDGLPMKFVTGDEGKREWIDEEAAKAALSGVLSPEKVYQPPKVITAPQAAKLLDKKKTAKTWEDIFKPLIRRRPGQRVLALGSDDRAPFTGAASAEEFADAAE